MEPANLTPKPDRGADPLESLLRTPSPSLPDDGFSARVLAALPAVERGPRLARPTLARWGGGFAALGTLCAFSLAAPWAELETAFTPVSVSFTEPGVLAALVVSVGSTVYALWPSLVKRAA